ncbi:hypothetical protein QBC47DRAFT_398908 [Echria macrotheca]|uniref:BZIP domain-containing protein n=1 Tax=Echria macrotheca TaxID=438768 RepID=A0AAJ0BHH7_9PEZI|nr:hypothetical protein QBC47DRAFT_398908 [Echria macrotheca]
MPSPPKFFEPPTSLGSTAYPNDFHHAFQTPPSLDGDAAQHNACSNSLSEACSNSLSEACSNSLSEACSNSLSEHPIYPSPTRSTHHAGLSLPKTRGRPPANRRPESPPDHETLLKRRRNNEAAKKCRQKKLDKIQQLEEEIEQIKRERDDLRIRLERQEAETAVLRDFMRKMTAAGRRT